MNPMDSDNKNTIAEQYDFYEARVLGITAEHFLSKVYLYHEYDCHTVVKYTFTECYRLDFSHAAEQVDHLEKSKWKPEFYTYAQIDYFIQDIDISKKMYGTNFLYQCSLDFGIARLEILCRDVTIEKLALLQLSEAEKRNFVVPLLRDRRKSSATTDETVNTPKPKGK